MGLPPRVVSVNVGQPRPAEWAGAVGATSIDKRPVRGPVAVHLLGLDGDSVSDTEHHGGVFQAVYAFAREDLDRWAERLGRPVPSGSFGENLTVAGLDLNACELGETWRVGSALLQVAAVRIPCATFQGWMGESGFDNRAWVRRFTQDGCPGAYLRVLEVGTLRAGDPVDVTGRPGHGVTVETMFRGWTTEPALLPLLLGVEGLSEEAYARARRYVAAQGR